MNVVVLRIFFAAKYGWKIFAIKREKSREFKVFVRFF